MFEQTNVNRDAFNNTCRFCAETDQEIETMNPILNDDGTPVDECRWEIISIFFGIQVRFQPRI